MPRRTREQVTAEFHRLYDRFEAAIEAAKPIRDFMDMDPDQIASRQEMLGWLEAGRSTASQLVAGVRSALADVRLGLADLERSRPGDAVVFHDRYAELRGERFDSKWQ